MGDIQPANARLERELAWHGGGRAHDVDGGHVAAADWIDRGGDARVFDQCRKSGVLAYCVIFGGVVPYALWNDALRYWRTSQVMLFNNLIPLSSDVWACYFLGEPLTHTFWAAMVLIVAGVILGQVDWTKIFGMPESF